jgi:hypothetical protein
VELCSEPLHTFLNALFEQSLNDFSVFKLIYSKILIAHKKNHNNFRDGQLRDSLVNHHRIVLKTMNKPAAMSSEDGIGKCGSIQSVFGGI